MSSIKEAQGSNLVFCALPGLATGFIVYLAIAVMGTGFFSNAAFFGGGFAALVMSAALIQIFMDPPAPIPSAAPSAPMTTAPAASDATQPALLSAAREGGADDLKKITGVGPKLEEELNAAGVYHYDQIASWTEAEVAWADENLVKFKGRISRDDWVGQAKALMDG
jgi:predicted flap endonuclease-1-like 5' DNA nuclease